MTFYDLFIKLKHRMMFESQTHPQDDHTDITDYNSTRYTGYIEPVFSISGPWKLLAIFFIIWCSFPEKLM